MLHRIARKAAATRPQTPRSVHHGKRNYASDRMTVFDRAAKKLQKDRAAVRIEEGQNVAASFDYIRKEIGLHLMDRVDDVKEQRTFPTVLELGARGNTAVELIQHRDDITRFFQTDSSERMLRRDESGDGALRLKPTRLVADEEHIPLRHKSVDLIVSNLSLHWVNDLPGTLIQCRHILKDDSPIMAVMFGENTLLELRNALVLAEQEREGGVSPHISPFAGIGDIGNLLGRAGFTMPTVDQESITIKYKDPFLLMHELQAMGENNAAVGRRPAMRRETLLAAAAIYQQMYGDADGAVPATFQLIYLTAWSPGAAQPKPAKRGSATHSLGDIGSIQPHMVKPSTPQS